MMIVPLPQVRRIFVSFCLSLLVCGLHQPTAALGQGAATSPEEMQRRVDAALGHATSPASGTGGATGTGAPAYSVPSIVTTVLPEGRRLLQTLGSTPYSSRGHPKACGLDITLQRPAAWQARDGSNHVVQSFVSELGHPVELSVVIAKAPPGESFTEEMAARLLTAEGIGGLLPKGGSLDAIHPVRLAGRPGSLVQVSQPTEGKEGRAGIMHTTGYIIPVQDLIVILDCGFVAPDEESAADLYRSPQHASIRTLLHTIAQTLTIAEPPASAPAPAPVAAAMPPPPTLAQAAQQPPPQAKRPRQPIVPPTLPPPGTTAADQPTLGKTYTTQGTAAAPAGVALTLRYPANWSSRNSTHEGLIQVFDSNDISVIMELFITQPDVPPVSLREGEFIHQFIDPKKERLKVSPHEVLLPLEERYISIGGQLGSVNTQIVVNYLRDDDSDSGVALLEMCFQLVQYGHHIRLKCSVMNPASGDDIHTQMRHLAQTSVPLLRAIAESIQLHPGPMPRIPAVASLPTANGSLPTVDAPAPASTAASSKSPDTGTGTGTGSWFRNPVPWLIAVLCAGLSYLLIVWLHRYRARAASAPAAPIQLPTAARPRGTPPPLPPSAQRPQTTQPLLPTPHTGQASPGPARPHHTAVIRRQDPAAPKSTTGIVDIVTTWRSDATPQPHSTEAEPQTTEPAPAQSDIDNNNASPSQSQSQSETAPEAVDADADAAAGAVAIAEEEAEATDAIPTPITLSLAGQTYGPYAPAEVIELWDTGQIAGNALYWHPGLPDYRPLVAGLEDLRHLP